MPSMERLQRILLIVLVVSALVQIGRLILG